MSDQQTNGLHTNGQSQHGTSGRPDEPEFHPPEQQCLEFCPICRAADVLRAGAPPELREQWQTVQREALLTTKAMIEHYLTRLDEEPEPPSSRVEDIPIT
jgi:hypothetical protein